MNLILERIESLKSQIAEKDRHIAEKDRHIAEKDRHIAKLTKAQMQLKKDHCIVGTVSVGIQVDYLLLSVGKILILMCEHNCV